jgi:hypothetical protein
MSELMKKIKDSANPAVHNRRDFVTIALVTDTDEINNVCSIEYIDKDGYKSNKNNVPVKILYPGLIAWFPKKGDRVNISVVNEDDVTITSLEENGYGSNIRAKTQLKKDVFSSSFGGTMGGMIF